MVVMRHTLDQRRAGSQLWYAIKKGRILAAKFCLCVDCGNPAHEYDHYLGYEREHYLDVQPVCRSCHHKRSFNRGEHPGPPIQFGFKIWRTREYKHTKRLKENNLVELKSSALTLALSTGVVDG